MNFSEDAMTADLWQYKWYIFIIDRYGRIFSGTWYVVIIVRWIFDCLKDYAFANADYFDY